MSSAVAQPPSVLTRGRARRRFRIRLRISPRYFITIPLAAFAILPIVYIISTAFKPLEELLLFPPPFFVRNPTLDNFTDLLLSFGSLSVPFTRYLFNSLFVVIVLTFAGAMLAALAAYPLAKLNPPLGNALFALVVAGLMFPPEVLAIPRYIVVANMGIIDTYWALILPNIAVPLGMFLMKQFMDQLPSEILEAARVDGASEWTVFWRIAMPMVSPAWNTVIILSFIAFWNDSFSPVVFTRSEAMKTVPYAMITIQAGANFIARQGAAAAAVFIMTTPTILVFILRQAKVVQTFAHAGIKS